MDEESGAVLGDAPDVLDLEQLTNPSECVVAEVKTEVIDPEVLQLATQQYIIVAPPDGG